MYLTIDFDSGDRVGLAEIAKLKGELGPEGEQREQGRDEHGPASARRRPRTRASGVLGSGAGVPMHPRLGPPRVRRESRCHLRPRFLACWPIPACAAMTSVEASWASVDCQAP